MKTFSELLRERRLDRELTLDEVAAEAGCHSTFVSLVERGRRRPDDAGVVRLAAAVGLDPRAALLAALRERLPEDLRPLVPQRGAPSETAAPGYQAARELQARHFDFEVERVAVSAVIDWEGGVRMSRVYDGCRPNSAGRPVWEIAFRERAAGLEPSADEALAKLQVRCEPKGLVYELRSETSGPWQRHRLVFPRGWRRTPRRAADTFSFALETRHRDVYSLDPAGFLKRSLAESLRLPFQGSFNYHLPLHTRALHLTVDFPPGYRPHGWEGWVWWGTEAREFVTRNLVDEGACAAFELRSQDGRAELRANEPLAGYTYAVVWTPADRQHYLEARYGDPR